MLNHHTNDYLHNNGLKDQPHLLPVNVGNPTSTKPPTETNPGALVAHAAPNLVNIRIRPERHLLGVVPIKLFGSGTTDKSAVFVAARYTSTPKFVVKRQKKELCHKVTKTGSVL